MYEQFFIWPLLETPYCYWGFVYRKYVFVFLSTSIFAKLRILAYLDEIKDDMLSIFLFRGKLSSKIKKSYFAGKTSVTTIWRSYFEEDSQKI